MNTRIHRRRWLASAAASTAGLLLLRNSASARSYQANEKLNIALIGLGARGGSAHVKSFPRIGENLVALCDVNQEKLDKQAASFPASRQFRDYRQMFDAMDRQIDAVVIATPVHSHALIASAAMKRRKHVYLEKPLTRTVAEARAMRDMARRYKVATQMGNQGMATDSFRRTLELIQDGAIGTLREAHVMFESGGPGPLARPAGQVVPATLDWDLWIGPAPMRPYHPGYLPPQFPGAGGLVESPALIGWNRWRDFGGGALGGAGSHSLNLAFKAFGLQALWDNPDPQKTIRVTTEISERSPENFPKCQLVHFDLPAHGTLPALQIHWCNAWNAEIKRRGILDRLEKLAGQKLAAKGSWSPGSFLLIVGSKGMAIANFHNSICKLLPEKNYPHADEAPQRLPHSGSHEREWVAACKTGSATLSNFDHAGPELELLNLGNIASLVDRPLEYCPATTKILNDPQAGALINPPYRKGWSLES
jgi:predicted dehydrogenase